LSLFADVQAVTSARQAVAAVAHATAARIMSSPAQACAFLPLPHFAVAWILL
jgi:hypothetical protein